MKLKDQTELTGKQKFYIFLLIFVIMATFGYGILRADYNEPKEELLVPLSYSASHFYPSDAIFGFIEGCWQQMELSQALRERTPSLRNCFLVPRKLALLGTHVPCNACLFSKKPSR